MMSDEDVRTERGALQYMYCVAQPLISTLQPDSNHGHWGQERCDAASRTRPYSDPDPVWAKRLQSTWGPHWECEEMVREGGYDLGFMRTCTSM
jgi:hypothetical protein